MEKCKICGKEYTKKGLGTHIWRNHGDGKNHGEKLINKFKGKKPWNYGLTKETNESVANAGKTYSQKIKNGELKATWKDKNLPKETIEKLKNNAGGYRRGSGRGKKGWYKGYWCDSTWELAFLIYHLDHNIKIERNLKSFEYFINEKKHKYYPDFIVDEKYFEIKGYMNDKDPFKFHANLDKKLEIISKEQIDFYLQYVKEKYKITILKDLYE